MVALLAAVRCPLAVALLLACGPRAAARHTHAVANLAGRGQAGALSVHSRTASGPGAAAVAHLAPELSPSFAHEDKKRAAKPEVAVPAEKHMESARGKWTHGFLKAFFVVSIAELFDKTWFMSLILALKMGWRMALAGGYTGLLLHCVLSALLGFGFSKLLKPSILHFITAGLFFLFTILYAKDWYYAEADSDLIASGREEAAEAMGDEPSGETTPETTNEDLKKPEEKKSKRAALAQAFLAVFIAEWGDRTQMAMIGLHSSLPVLPVFVGSALAFFLLTVSAVVVASFIAKAKLSERLVMGTASLSFLVFAILALLDGLRAKQHGQ
mmetsp:Transcript_27803/g.86550  ORF Transcript_27803/g.86550 Transcript_27803/m.86550 type:complete len:327 (+) Transcript_27803:96-1076(+)